MCEQCLVNPLFYGEVIPGWYLIKARRESSSMRVGDWGLLRINNPDFIWSTFDFEPSDENAITFYDCWSCAPETGHALFSSALKAGFTEDDSLFYWLGSKIQEHIKNTIPEVEEDYMPQLNEYAKHDYSILK